MGFPPYPHPPSTTSHPHKERPVSPSPTSPRRVSINNPEKTSQNYRYEDERKWEATEKHIVSRSTIAKGFSFSLLPVLSCVFALLLFAQFFLEPSYLQYTRQSPKRYARSYTSPSARIELGARVCESPKPFPTESPVSRLNRMKLLEEAKRVAGEFEFADADVAKTVRHFIEQMNEGLHKNATTMSQIPTYVTAVPNGTEKGLYLAVDLGGTNFRVCSIQLHGDTTFSLTQSKVAIPRELMVAKTAKELFAFLAKQIELFLKTHHVEHFEAHVRRRQTVSTPEGYRDEQIFRLGFTFSFPVHQIGINRGTLIRWTKGFDIADAIGQDVCALLQEEIDNLHLPVRVAALVNDTVGTLMSRSYTSPGEQGTLLGAIFGTGTNGAYVEKLSKITKTMEGEYDKSTGEMIVNTEWGSFDNELTVLPNTPYDQILDAESVNPGIQMFEKRISGMFLGEILRLVIGSMIKNPAIALFRDDNSSHNDIRSTTTIDENSPLFTKNAVDSSILSIAEADNSVGLRALRQELDKSLGVSAASSEDAEAIKIIAHAIAKRAARLAGVAVAAIILETSALTTTTEDIDIGVDGSLVEFYPGFEDYMRSAIKAVPEIGAVGEKRIQIGIAKDGSGVGAALIALVAASQEKEDIPIEEARRKLSSWMEEGNEDVHEDTAIGTGVQSDDR